jgi:Skp family chaperone for outer membrane proteins
MRKPAATILLTILLLLPMPSYAQNSQSAISPVDKNKIIARLLTEIDTARAYIAELEKRQHALEAEIKAADEAHAALTEAYKTALLELGELRATVKFQEAALKEREQQVTELRAERDDLRAKLKSAHKREVLMGILTAVLIYTRH